MRRREFTLPADTVSPRTARERVRGWLGTWGDGDSRDTVVLLVSELVTNSIVHARTALTVRLETAGRAVTVEVDDGNTESPARRTPRANHPGGRGLVLLDELADRWGVRERPDGKTVWFELAAPAPDVLP
jgi:anti-sigma regulatory factor (Ser/Thr protein kinase)